MTVKDLKQSLDRYPEDTTVVIAVNPTKPSDAVEFTNEHLVLDSATSFIDNKAPQEEWDHEDGKIRHGNGRKFLVINPPIQ